MFNNNYGCRPVPATGVDGANQILSEPSGGNAGEGMMQPKLHYKIQLLLPAPPSASGMSGYFSCTDTPISHGTSSC